MTGARRAVWLTLRASRGVRDLPRARRRRVQSALLRLRETPAPSTPLSGLSDGWRWDVHGTHVLYQLREHQVFVLDVRPAAPGAGPST